jgi:hypothetical protein
MYSTNQVADGAVPCDASFSPSQTHFLGSPQSYQNHGIHPQQQQKQQQQQQQSPTSLQPPRMQASVQEPALYPMMQHQQHSNVLNQMETATERDHLPTPQNTGEDELGRLRPLMSKRLSWQQEYSVGEFQDSRAANPMLVAGGMPMHSVGTSAASSFGDDAFNGSPHTMLSGIAKSDMIVGAGSASSSLSSSVMSSGANGALSGPDLSRYGGASEERSTDLSEVRMASPLTGQQKSGARSRQSSLGLVAPEQGPGSEGDSQVAGTPMDSVVVGGQKWPAPREGLLALANGLLAQRSDKSTASAAFSPFDGSPHTIPRRRRGPSVSSFLSHPRFSFILFPMSETQPSVGLCFFCLGQIVSRVTVCSLKTFQACNPHFAYDSTSNPRRVLTKPSEPCGNDGFDNADADLILYVNDVIGTDDGQRKFMVVEILGQGTFGQVAKCVNLKTGETVAVKVIKNKPAYTTQSMMEVKILQLVSN